MKLTETEQIRKKWRRKNVPLMTRIIQGILGAAVIFAETQEWDEQSNIMIRIVKRSPMGMKQRIIVIVNGFQKSFWLKAEAMKFAEAEALRIQTQTGKVAEIIKDETI